MTARAPGGSVSYVGALTYKNLTPMANFAFQTLRSLRYRAMRIGMDGDLGGEIVTRVTMRGVSQGPGAQSNILTRQVAKLPIQFNVNIRAPFIAVARLVPVALRYVLYCRPAAVDGCGRPAAADCAHAQVAVDPRARAEAYRHSALRQRVAAMIILRSIRQSRAAAGLPVGSGPPAGMARRAGLAVRMSLMLIAGALVAGCVSVNAPDKPIVIELNINIKQEVIYRLSADANKTIDSNKEIF